MKMKIPSENEDENVESGDEDRTRPLNHSKLKLKPKPGHELCFEFIFIKTKLIPVNLFVLIECISNI